jgi:hypothetical protein
MVATPSQKLALQHIQRSETYKHGPTQCWPVASCFALTPTKQMTSRYHLDGNIPGQTVVP